MVWLLEGCVSSSSFFFVSKRKLKQLIFLRLVFQERIWSGTKLLDLYG